MGIGVGFKDVIVELGGWCIGMIVFGEMLLYYDNCIFLNKDKKDKWGLLVLEMDVEIKENEIVMCKDMKDDVVEMFECVGFKNVCGYEGDYVLGMGIYEMGGVCMGCDFKMLVINKFN